MLQQQQEEIVFGEELATTKVDEIVAASMGRGQIVRKILKNYCFLIGKLPLLLLEQYPQDPIYFTIVIDQRSFLDQNQ